MSSINEIFINIFKIILGISRWSLMKTLKFTQRLIWLWKIILKNGPLGMPNIIVYSIISYLRWLLFYKIWYLWDKFIKPFVLSIVFMYVKLTICK